MGSYEEQLVSRAIMDNEPCQGKYVKEFEELVASATGRAWCVATCSGTSALHLALSVLGWTDGVYMPSYTFAATANAVAMVGAEISFSDVDPETWVADHAGSDLVVETFGNYARGTLVDAACSIGSGEVGGKYKLACLSFNGNKTITTGGGGAIVGDNIEREHKIRGLMGHANAGNYNYHSKGFNYAMPNVNAAIGVAQMSRLDEFVKKKRGISQRYKEELPYDPVPHSEGSACWISGYQTHEAMNHIHKLNELGIGAAGFWEPLHLQAPWKDCPRGNLEVTEKIWNRVVMLPSSTSLTDEQQTKVIDAVLSLRQEGQTGHP